MMNPLLAIALLSAHAVPSPLEDSVTVAIRPVAISVSLKSGGDYDRQPVAATSLEMDKSVNALIVEPKNLSLTVPNMLHADYGARMTGSIYVRGMGSRMDQPAVGLYVDGVPILNKNNYDFDYFDVQRIDVLRGPQGTLYGRNTIGGVIDVQTLSPFDFQGVRLGLGYGNGNSLDVRAAIYRKPTQKFGWSLSASHRSTDGFFTNEYDGSHADRSRTSALRFKLQARLSDRWTLANSLYAGLVGQNGFPYAPYDEATGHAGEINHDDPCTYDRFGIIEGLTLRYEGSGLRLSSTTGYQFTDDDMVLDQDFSPRSMFTLRQSQKEHAFTQEITARSATTRRWQWITGLFGFHRALDMDAPVLFKRDGIDELILANANRGIHTVLPDYDLSIREESFPIRSNFDMPSSGLSLYHQSTWDVGRWGFTAGLRADLEHTAIRYRNSAEINYSFNHKDAPPDYKYLPVAMSGDRGRSFFELMPRAAVMYEIPAGNIYVSLAHGYKAGGYNTQIFSDILQNRMMNDLMTDLGMYPDESPHNIDDAISYEPERSWNYEIGGHFSPADRRVSIDAALFWIDCRNRQIVVFPPGNGTGRLMSNAGRTRSLGAEITAVWRLGDLNLIGSYGYTDARFLVYDDHDEEGDPVSYAGNRVPYSPQNTLSVQGEYGVDLRGGDAGRLTLVLGVQGAGRIYWNESNTISQPFYVTMNASADWTRGAFGVSLWARNLTGTDYNTFYFKSVGRSFVQRGKPLQTGITLSITLL
jgi:outer membrane receptor protein involved in Fe transport